MFDKLWGKSLKWQGPEFLKLAQPYWPKSPGEKELETEVAMKEKLQNDPQIVHEMLTSESST